MVFVVLCSALIVLLLQEVDLLVASFPFSLFQFC